MSTNTTATIALLPQGALRSENQNQLPGAERQEGRPLRDRVRNFINDSYIFTTLACSSCKGFEVVANLLTCCCSNENDS